MYHHHHHHLWHDSPLWAFQKSQSPAAYFLFGFPDNRVFTGWGSQPYDQPPNMEDQAFVFVTPGDRVAQLYPQALGTHFSRLLRHAWVTVGLLLFPGHHKEDTSIILTIHSISVDQDWKSSKYWLPLN
jgi:hypothetical protein